MAKNDIYLVKQNTDGTWQEIPVGDNLGDSPMTYDDNFTLHINTKLRVDELEVNGLTTVKDQDVTTSEQLLVTNDGTGTAVVINQIGLDGLIDIQDDGETALFIRGDNAFGGFVGLGTKEAQEQLHITGSMLLEHQQLIMSYNDANTKTPVLGINGDNFTELSNVGSGIKFSTGDSTTSPKVTILENGNVGIGYENPAARLQIHTTDNTTIYDPTDTKPPAIGDCLLTLRNDYTGGLKAGTFAGLQLNVDGGADGQSDQNAVAAINLVIEEDGSRSGALTFSPSSSSAERPEAMRINSLGHVGIGTTDPQEPLHIETTSDTVVRLTQVLGSSGYDQSHIAFYTKDQTSENIMGRMGIFTDPNDSNVDEALFLNSHDSNNIVFRTGSATRMLIQNSTGNVGIGTTTPDEKLHVSGTLKATRAKLADLDIRSFSESESEITDLLPAGYSSQFGTIIETDPNGQMIFGIRGNDENDAFRILTKKYASSTADQASRPYNYAALCVESSGNVGVGTASPDQPFTVKPETVGKYGIHILKNEAGEVSLGGIFVEADGTSSLYLKDRDFTNATTGASTIRLRAKGDSYFMGGNIGIGTPAPDSLLHLKHTKGAAVDGFNTLKLESPDPTILLSDSTNAGDMSIMWQAAPSSTGLANQDGGLIFYRDGDTSDVNFMINTDGNVGIGTTAPSANLHVLKDMGNTNVDGSFTLQKTAYTRSDSHPEGSGQIMTHKLHELSYSGDFSTVGNNHSNDKVIGLDVNLDTNAGGQYAALFNGGNVGIGTNSPGSTLEINAGTNDSALHIKSTIH